VTVLFNDFETYSDADLFDVGQFKYARDRTTKALMLAYAFDDERIQQWVPAEGQKMPSDLRDALRDPDVIKSAWNASFEKVIWQYVLGEEIFDDEWRCSMVRAYTLSFPGKLAAVGPIVRLPMDQQKDKEGKALIKLFCQPKNPPKRIAKNPKPFIRVANMYTHPDEWEKFKDYNRQDVEAERAIWNRTKKWDLPAHEWEMWALDQEINRDGIPVNMKVVEKAIEFVEYIREKRFARLREITGVDNPNSRPQLLDWLQRRGYRFDDLKKGHVVTASTDEELDDLTREVLELRLEVSKTSTDKYYAMQRAATDGVVQGALQFAGAQRTWRWSGRIFQPQNLARPAPDLEATQEACVRNLERLSPKSLELIYDKPMDFLSTCIRPTIQAGEGEIIFGADLNAIENRVLGYLAQDQKILDVFRNKRDPYLDFARYMFESTYEEEKERFKPADGSKGNKDHRTTAKPGVLGCGYMLSAGKQKENKKTGEIEATGLLGYAWNMGVKSFTLEDAKLSVETWRETFSGAVEYWWEIEKAAKRCLRSGDVTWAGPVRFDISGPFMRMKLPSGRFLHYCRPRLDITTQYWCREEMKYLPYDLCIDPDKRKQRQKENITYEGLNDRGGWGRIWTHPGKLTENADQAISRDLLAEGMRRFRRRVPRSLARIRLHVHDEIVGWCKEERGDEMLKILIECMEEPMPWASEEELPLGAAGSLGKVWIKD